MGLGDRDYMRRDGSGGPLKFPDLTPRPWYRRIRWTTAIPVATSVLVLGSAAIWFYSDARSVIAPAFSSEPSTGTLIVNINTATLEELESLPQIGAARAQLIVRHRPYQTVDDLKRINTIPDAVIDDLKPLLTVEGQTRLVDP
jgi:hypothetical protein